MKNIIVSNKPWHRNYIHTIEEVTSSEIVYIEDKNLVTYDNFQQYQPRYIFFPHWSNIIPTEVYKNFECIIFHMTDLPFGRGGSPLQNLIVRKIYETKLSALRCEEKLDAGDIYMKKSLSLQGTAEEIYLRAAKLTEEMIVEIICNKIQPIKQKGEVVFFNRRKPSEGDIKDLHKLEDVYDYIRMLDAESYPRAFLKTERFYLEFERASLKDGYIHADVKIRMRGSEDE